MSPIVRGVVALSIVYLNFCLRTLGQATPPSATNAGLTAKLGAITVIARNSTGGKQCRLPVVFRGTLDTDCTPPLVNGSDPALKCFTKGLAVREKCIMDPATKPQTLLSLLTAGNASDGALGSLCTLNGSGVAALTTAHPLPACATGTVCIALVKGPLAGTGMGSCVRPDDPDQGKQAAVLESQLRLAAKAGANNVTRALGPSAAKDVVDQVAGEGGTSPVGAVTGLADVGVAPRRTYTGQKCRLPLVYKGALQLDCFDVDGFSSCFAAGQEQPMRCAPGSKSAANVSLGDLLEAGTASDGALGALCALNPRNKLGNFTLPACGSTYSCTPLQSTPLGGSGMGFCAVAGERSSAEAPGPSGSDVLSKYTAVQRMTIINETCRLPIVYGEALLLDCVPLSGPNAHPECFVEGLRTVDECSPTNRTSSTLTALLGSGAGVDGLEGSLCAVKPSTPTQKEKQVCKPAFDCIPLTGPLESSGWGYCTPAAPAPADALDTSATPSSKDYFVNLRTTKDGRKCHLPYVAGGNLFLDCTDHDAKSWCHPFDGNGTEAECAPQDKPTAVALSELMAQGKSMDGKVGSLCTETPGWRGQTLVGCTNSLACEPLIGPLLDTGYGHCVDLGVGRFGMTAIMRAVKVQQRHTQAGVPCRLPLIINQQLVVDCMAGTDGRTQQCVTGNNLTLMESCDTSQPPAAIPLSVQLAKGTGSDGNPGSICALGTNTTGAPGDCQLGLKCTVMNNPPLFGSSYGYCDTDPDAKVPFSPGPPAIVSAPSPPGPPAAAPVTAPSPSMDQTLTGIKIPTRVTATGQACRLPLIYRGQLMTDCQTLVDTSFEQCFVAKTSGPQPCAPNDITAPEPTPLGAYLAAGKGLDGAEGSFCVLPGPAGKGKAQGKATDKALSQGGVGCDAGFSCIPLQASLTNSGYGYCGNAQAGTAPVQTGNLAGGLKGVSVAKRQAISGQSCRLPIVFRDELMTDCKALDGSTTAQCFISGLDTAQDCAAADHVDSQPLQNLLLSGSASDGGEGSLCTPGPKVSDPAPLLSQGGRPLLCSPQKGLNCLPLQAGGIAGSGFGYCSTRQSPYNNTASPLSLPVSVRYAMNRQQCRLPIMYKGVLQRGCMQVDNMAQCVVGADLAETQPCAATASGYNLTTVGALLDDGAAGKDGALCKPEAPTGTSLGCQSSARCQLATTDPLKGSGVGFCTGGQSSQSASPGGDSVGSSGGSCGMMCRAGIGIGILVACIALIVLICCRRRLGKKGPASGPAKAFNRYDSTKLADDPMADYNSGKAKGRYTTPSGRDDSATRTGFLGSFTGLATPAGRVSSKGGAGAPLVGGRDSHRNLVNRELEKYEADAYSQGRNPPGGYDSLVSKTPSFSRPSGGSAGMSPFERRLSSGVRDSANENRGLELVHGSGPSATSSVGTPVPAKPDKYRWAPIGPSVTVQTPKQKDVVWVPEKMKPIPPPPEPQTQLAGRWAKSPTDFAGGPRAD